MVKKHIIQIFMILIAAVALSACHKELCYQHPHSCGLEVVFDWEEAPEASPTTMSLYLYPLESENDLPLRYEFKGRDGGIVSIPEGSYAAVCLNSDLRLLSITEGTRAGLLTVISAGTQVLSELGRYGITEKNIPRAEGTGEERIASSADHLYTGTLEQFAISRNDKDRKIVIKPMEATRRIRVEIRNVENSERLLASGAALTTLSGSFMPWDFTATNERVTIPLDLTLDQERTTLTGSFLTFGCPPYCEHDPARHNLSVYAIMEDGEKVWLNMDVSDQIHDAPDPHDILIVIDRLPLPSPTPEGGFHPIVNPWRELTIGILM